LNADDSGRVALTISPIWRDEDQEMEAMDCESLHDLSDLNYLDLEICVIRCNNLPSQFASDVRVEFELPTFITNAILPEDWQPGTGIPDHELALLRRKGGKYTTPLVPELRDTLNQNPEINHRRVIRILNMNFKTREWFNNANLMVRVLGEPPVVKGKKRGVHKIKNVPASNRIKIQRNASSNDSSSIMQKMTKMHKGTALARATLHKVIEEKKHLQAEVEALRKELSQIKGEAYEMKYKLDNTQTTLKAGQKTSAIVSDELAEAKRRVKKAEAREAARAKEVEELKTKLAAYQSGGGTADGALQAIMEQMAEMKKQAEKDRAELEAARNKKSRSCVIQ
jgi:regulator of replication initiation timing